MRARASLQVQAPSIARAAAPRANDRFLSDFEAVTQNSLMKVACDFTVDQLSKPERGDAGASEDEGPPPVAQAVVDAALERLVDTYSPTSIRQVVSWTLWTSDVMSA